MELIKKNPAQVMAVVTALLALAATYIPGLPQEAILAVVAAVIFGGYKVQRIEDVKTEEALDEPAPCTLGMERQMAVLAAENEALAAQVGGACGGCPVAPEPRTESTAEIEEFSLEDGKALFRA